MARTEVSATSLLFINRSLLWRATETSSTRNDHALASRARGLASLVVPHGHDLEPFSKALRSSSSFWEIPLLLNILAPRPLISLSLPHTTLRCDHGPAPKAFSHLTYHEWEGGDPCIPKSRCLKLRHWAPSTLRVSGIPAAEEKCFKFTMGEAATEPDRMPRAPPDGWPGSFWQYCGPGSWTPSALRISRLGGGWSSFFKVMMREEAIEPNHAPHVPL
jgi:hypothetical protein